MAIVTKTIGTASRDYSTIALWEAAIPANLVTAGDSWVGQCFNDSEFLVTSGLTISGHTTDSTHNITLTTGAGQSFRDNAGVLTNALRYNVSNGVGIRTNTGYVNLMTVSCSFTVLDKLQLGLTNGDGCVIFNAASCVVQNSILQGTNSTNAPTLTMGNNSSASACKSLNNLIICKRAGFAQIPILFGNDGLQFVVNNTIVCPSDASAVGTGIALKTNSGGHYAGLNKVVNTAVFGFASFTDDITNFGSSGNNCTDLASTTVPGSSNQVSKTYSNQFSNTVQATMDFRAKAAADLLDNGSTDTTDIPSATDIVGTSRPQGSAWDIGAWELVSASGNTGTLATTETPDTLAFTGTVLISGTLATTEGSDVVAFNGTVVNAGTLAATDTQDIASFSGTIANLGTLVATETQDTGAFAGTVVNFATLAAVENADTASFIGTVGNVISGALAATEAADTGAFTGTVVNLGTLTVTESQDVVAFSGTVLVSGTLAATENSDIAVFNGSVTSALTGTLAVTERQDIALFLSDPIVGGAWRWKEGVAELQKNRQTTVVNQTVAIQKAAAVLSKMGGEARAKSLTAVQRTTIATNAAKARWK